MHRPCSISLSDAVRAKGKEARVKQENGTKEASKVKKRKEITTGSNPRPSKKKGPGRRRSPRQGKGEKNEKKGTETRLIRRYQECQKQERAKERYGVKMKRIPVALK